MKCRFSNTRKEDNGTNSIEIEEVPKKDYFHLLGWCVHKEGDIEDDVVIE